jgi:ankyrin repeat protein
VHSINVSSISCHRHHPLQQGYLPLHVAIENGNVLVAKELLSHSAEVQIKLTFGTKSDTAFHAAARKRDVDLLRLLAEHGAQVDARNVKR